MYCAEEQLLVSRLSILNFLVRKGKSLLLPFLFVPAVLLRARSCACMPRWSQLPSPSLQTELPSQRRYPLMILMRRRPSRASMRPHPGERRQREIGGCHRRLMTSRKAVELPKRDSLPQVPTMKRILLFARRVACPRASSAARCFTSAAAARSGTLILLRHCHVLGRWRMDCAA